MARVFTQSAAKSLGLPGRTALEIVSGEAGASGITLRKVRFLFPLLAIHREAATCTKILKNVSMCFPVRE
jgi:hypothetical protein